MLSLPCPIVRWPPAKGKPNIFTLFRIHTSSIQGNFLLPIEVADTSIGSIHPLGMVHPLGHPEIGTLDMVIFERGGCLNPTGIEGIL